MSRIRMFMYRFDDGHVDCMEPDRALEYSKKTGAKITSDGYLRSLGAPLINRIKDGFQPGWNAALGQYVGGSREYAKILNSRGLVEIGKETQSKTESAQRLDAELVQELRAHGAEISDRAVDALNSGESLHKSTEENA